MNSDHDLIDAWLDGVADAAQVAELDRRLRTEPALCQALAERMRLHWVLSRTRRAERGSASIARPPATHRGRRRSRPPAARPWAALTALAAVVLVGVLLWLAMPRAPSAPVVMPVAMPSAMPAPAGVSDWTFADGRVAPPGSDLHGPAELSWRDGRTTARLAADSILRPLSGPAPHLALAAGVLELDVAPQAPLAPLRVDLPHGTATVLGTRLRLSCTATWSELQVHSGRVRLADHRGTARDVTAGGRALLGAGPRITTFRLVDADRGTDVPGYAPLVDGMTLDRTRLPPRITVVVDVDGAVESVSMRVNGALVQNNNRGAENTPPYSLTGDAPGGRFHAWEPQPGPQRFTAIPFSADDAGGIAGDEVTLTVHLPP